AVCRKALFPDQQNMFTGSAPAPRARRHGRGCGAMMVAVASNDLALRLFAASLVVEDRELQRRFDRLRSAAGGIESREPRRSPSRKTINQLLALGRGPDGYDVIEVGDRARRYL